MTDVAQLGLSIDSGQATRATQRLDRLTHSGRQAERATERMERKFMSLNRNMGTFAKVALGAAAALGAFSAARTVLRDISAFETGLVGVGKTTGITGKELAALGNQVRNISERVPVATTELLGLAQSAGQLGVKGSANISRFTETVGKLGIASDLAGEQAATSFARILTVTGTAISEVDRLGASIVQLGNNFAATESEIAGAATRVAQATSQFGVSADEVLGIGTALRAVGVEAEAGGTQIGLAFQSINDAVRQGGEQLQALERITGRAGEALREDFLGGQTTEVFSQFIEGLNGIQRSGGDVASALAELDLNGVRAVQVLGTLATRSSVLDDALRQANEGYTENTALNEEAATATETFSNQVRILRNTFSNILSSGDVDGLTGSVKELTATLQDPEVRSGIQSLAQGMINATSAATKLAAKLGEVYQGLRIVAGFGGGNEAVDLSDQIIGLRREIEHVENRLIHIPSIWDVIAGDITRSDVLDTLNEQLRITEARFNAIISNGQSVQDAVENLNRFGIMQRQREEESAFSLLDPNRPMIFRRGGQTIEPPSPREQGKASEAAAERIENLKREVALFGELSNAEATRIALSRGFYGEVTPEQEKELLRLARILDQKEANLEASEKQAQAEKERLEQVQQLERALETEEEAARRVYRQRKTLIERNVEDEERRAELIRRNEKQLAEDLEEIRSRNASEIEKLFDNAVENIQRSFGDMFTEIFRNGLSGFEDFVDRVKDIFARLAGEIAAVFAQRAIGDIILGATGGTGALADIARKMGGGQGGLLGAVGDIPGVGSIATSVVEGVATSLGFSVGEGAAGLTTQIGAKLGFKGDILANAAQTGAETTPGVLPGTLSGALGAAAGGFGGFQLGGMIGQRFGGETGGEIGGAFGGAVGSIAGPLGTAIGSAAGGLFGSGLDRLFSGGSSTAERFTGALDVAFPGIGSLVSGIFGIGDVGRPRLATLTAAERSGTNTSFKGTPLESPFGFVGFSQKASETAGRDISDSELNRKFGSVIQGLDEKAAQFLTDAQMEAVREALQSRRGSKGVIGGGMRVAVGNEKEFGRIIADRFRTIFEAIDEQLPEAIRKGVKTGGGDPDKIIKAGLGTLQQFFTERVKAITDEINAITSEMTAQANEMLQFRQAFGQAGESISQQLFRMVGTSASPLSPTEQLGNARSQFEDLLSRAQGGDIEALQQVSGSAQNFLDIARTNFASSPEFFERFDFVQSGLEGLQGVISEQQGRITDVMSDLNINIDRQTQLTVGRLDTLIDATREQSDRLDELSDRLERVAPADAA